MNLNESFDQYDEEVSNEESFSIEKKPTVSKKLISPVVKPTVPKVIPKLKPSLVQVILIFLYLNIFLCILIYIQNPAITTSVQQIPVIQPLGIISFIYLK